MKLVNTPVELRKLILTTEVKTYVGNRIYWMNRPQGVDIIKLLPCINIARVSGISDLGNAPLGKELWELTIEGNTDNECITIDNILRSELNGHPYPHKIAPGILSVNLLQGPYDGFNKTIQKPFIQSTYELRVAFEV